MRAQEMKRQGGQAIVLVALIIVVLFGFLGLAIDGGRGYIDRRLMQTGVDAGALAAAYTYMNTVDYAQSEQAAISAFASNERVYTTPSCSGFGSAAVSCQFGDATSQTVAVTVVDHSIAGVAFTVTASHRIPVTIMQVLGAGPAITVGATATAVARRPGSTAAAIQTLAPYGCPGSGYSLRITGTESTEITGDVWANGQITSNGSATAFVDGNVVDICPPIPPSIPGFTTTGVEANGWAIPDPDIAMPELNTTPRTWGQSDYGVVRLPGTYAADPKLGGGAGCFFFEGGVYTWAAGITINGGFVSNELRPPDEPALTSTAAALGGTISSIAVAPLPAAIAGRTFVTVAGQAFHVTAAGAAAGATVIPVDSANVNGTIASGTTVVTMTRAPYQFWDSNSVRCSGSFQPYPAAADASNPAVDPATYGVVVTAIRPSDLGVIRETSPSLCRLVDVGAGQVVKVWVSNVPGAAGYRVYAANGSCAGPFGLVGTIANPVVESNRTVSGCAPALAPNAAPPIPLSNCDLGTSSQTFNAGSWTPDPNTPPPAPEGPPPGPPPLPNSDAGPATAIPPAGDRANENQCVNTSGARVPCPLKVTAGYVTPGAIEFYLPGTESSTCTAPLNMNGGADSYLFSGQQYLRVLLYEPGPQQSSAPNTCSNSVAGHGVTSLLGIFYMPAASVTITGNSGYLASIAGGVIAWTATINGNGSVSIVGDPSLRTWPAWVALTQ